MALVKQVVCATPEEAVQAFLGWDGWNITRSTDADTRARSVQAAKNMLAYGESDGIAADAFLASSDAEVGAVLKGRLDYSPTQRTVYADQAATIEAYSDLARLATALSGRIADLETAARQARARGEMARSRDLEGQCGALLTTSGRVSTLIAIAGGCWCIGNNGAGA